MTKRYSTGDLALQGVDLSIPDGQVLALIGPSGAGKSTIIRCVNRLVEPTTGSAILNDINLTNLSAIHLRKARRKMGMIVQEYALVARLPVMENVLSGRLGYVGFWRSYFRIHSEEFFTTNEKMYHTTIISHCKAYDVPLILLGRRLSSDLEFDLCFDEPWISKAPKGHPDDCLLYTSDAADE